MAYVNIPANLQDIFYSMDDRIRKLESGPNSAQETADTANATAGSAYTTASTAVQTSANTIVNASNHLTAINGNGITVYAGASSTSGARVVLNSAGLAGFNSGGTATFALDSSTGNVSMTGTVTATAGQIGNWSIQSSGYMTNSSLTTILNSAATGTGNALVTNAGVSASQGTIGSGTNASGYSFSVGGTCSVGGVLSTFNDVNLGSSSELRVPYAYSNTVTNAATVWISSTGQLRRSTASSERYKEDIVNISEVPELDPKKLLDLPVRSFVYKDDYISDTDERYKQNIPGFIAEEVASIYPIAADSADGKVESWNERMIIPGLLALVQDLSKRVTELETQLSKQ